MNDPFSTARAPSLSDDMAEKLSLGLEQRATNKDQVQMREAVLSEAIQQEGIMMSSTSATAMTVLEIGCGTGPICRAIAAMGNKKKNVARVIGSDPSTALLQKARELTAAASDGSGDDVIMEWLECFGSNVPLPDESVDLVVIWTVFTHVPTTMHDEVLSEAWRLLKAGGRVVLFDNDACSWTVGLTDNDDVLQQALDKCTSMLQDKYIVRKFPSMLVSSGFQPKRLQIHAVLEDCKESYGYYFLTERVPLYTMMANVMSQEAADMVKQESDRRINDKTFQFLLSYGSVIGQKKPIST